MKKWYCPVCAKGLNPNSQCPFCGHDGIESDFDESHYIEIAKQMFPYGDDILDDEMYYRMKSYDAAVKVEYMKNPLFDQQKYEARLEEKNARINAYVARELAKRRGDTTPRCPTCSSTNIQKISLAKGYIHYRMFGFLSKTARSQFECRSCGYKW